MQSRIPPERLVKYESNIVDHSNPILEGINYHEHVRYNLTLNGKMILYVNVKLYFIHTL